MIINIPDSNDPCSLYVEGEVEYGVEALDFVSTQYTSCKTMFARDDSVSDGTHMSMLTIGMASWSSVPVTMSSWRIPIIVLDNDGEKLK